MTPEQDKPHFLAQEAETFSDIKEKGRLRFYLFETRHS